MRKQFFSDENYPLPRKPFELAPWACGIEDVDGGFIAYECSEEFALGKRGRREGEWEAVRKELDVSQRFTLNGLIDAIARECGCPWGQAKREYWADARRAWIDHGVKLTASHQLDKIKAFELLVDFD